MANGGDVVPRRRGAPDGAAHIRDRTCGRRRSPGTHGPVQHKTGPLVQAAKAVVRESLPHRAAIANSDQLGGIVQTVTYMATLHLARQQGSKG